ncbi:MAG: hypothetical protein U1F60_15065 [Planctomycetota bacterium]
MKYPTILLSSLLAFVATACQSTGARGNVATEGKAAESAESQMVADLAAAQHLARWGRQNKNALALAAAAAVMNQTPAGDDAPKPPAAAADMPQKDSKATPATAESLLAEARALAGGDQAMLAAIARAGEASRGRKEGPGSVTTRVGARSEDIYNETYRGGEIARVTVDGDGDTDLDVYVFDENGNLIASDDDGTDFCVVSWRPRWTGPFRIVVRNLGNVYNRYTLTTN